MRFFYKLLLFIVVSLFFACDRNHNTPNTTNVSNKVNSNNNQTTLSVNNDNVNNNVAVSIKLPDFTKLVEDTGSAVVSISSEKKISDTNQYDYENDPFFQFFSNLIPDLENDIKKSYGSGFIISEDGYIITNAHVVKGLDYNLKVTLKDRRVFSAKIIGLDKLTDIALLKINEQNLPIIKIGNASEIKVGEWVVAIGAPFGFENSVTAGIISAKKRSIDGDSSYTPYIQTDVAVNPGNSGGPLLNLKGQVIGINSQIFSDTGAYMGISFAVPVDVAMAVVNQLKSTGKVQRGRLGVMVQSVTYELSKAFGLDSVRGALITDVFPGSTAESADLKVGDIILSINNNKQIDSSNDLPYLIGSEPVGKELSLIIWRNKKEIKIPVKLSKLKEQERLTNISNKNIIIDENYLNEIENIKFKLPRFNIIVAPAPKILLNTFNEKKGLLVIDANHKSNSIGIYKGDIIISVNGKYVNDVNSLENSIKNSNEYMYIYLVRFGQKLFVTVPWKDN